MAISKKICFVSNECVACGTCLKVCPKNAIDINTGIKANINIEKCVGCGKCVKVCPASVMSLKERI